VNVALVDFCMADEDLLASPERRIAAFGTAGMFHRPALRAAHAPHQVGSHRPAGSPRHSPQAPSRWHPIRQSEEE